MAFTSGCANLGAARTKYRIFMGALEPSRATLIAFEITGRHVAAAGYAVV